MPADKVENYTACELKPDHQKTAFKSCSVIKHLYKIEGAQVPYPNTNMNRLQALMFYDNMWQRDNINRIINRIDQHGYQYFYMLLMAHGKARK